MSEASLREHALQLAARADLGAPESIDRLPGGRNNRVFRVKFAERTAILKAYHHDETDLRDRLKAEWEFLGYLEARSADHVPKRLACDSGHHMALYSEVPGRKPATISDSLVWQAADFAIAINGPPHEPAALAPASEACFCLADHVSMIERRIARLSELDPAVPDIENVRAFVEGRLRTAWVSVKSDVTRKARERGVPLHLPIKNEIVSPSDFGFHNALVDERGKACFVDFEYAGRDDAAKLICDFFCQPELAVPFQYYDEFTHRLASALHLEDGDLWRARVLLDVYRIKWVCIILNEFCAGDARRRRFADDGESRASDQLRKAALYLQRHLGSAIEETNGAA